MKRRPPPRREARFGPRPKVGDFVEILVAEEPFEGRPRHRRNHRAPRREGANLKGRLLIID